MPMRQTSDAKNPSTAAPAVVDPAAQAASEEAAAAATKTVAVAASYRY
jgi:hypothetical protein